MNEEMKKLQQESTKYVQEMKARAKPSKDTHQNKTNEKTKTEIKKSNVSPKQNNSQKTAAPKKKPQKTNKRNNTYQKNISTPKKTMHSPEQEHKKKTGFFDGLPNLLDLIFKDEEKSLIIVLIVLLMGEEDNLTILLVLFYLLL